MYPLPTEGSYFPRMGLTSHGWDSLPTDGSYFLRMLGPTYVGAPADGVELCGSNAGTGILIHFVSLQPPCRLSTAYASRATTVFP